MKFVASFDKFGAVFKPKLKQEQNKYKTAIGGITTIVIYLVSFIYFCYKFYQFGQNEINPIQSIAYEYKENLTIADNEELLSLEIVGTQINPFNKTAQILVPMKIFRGTKNDTLFYQDEEIYNSEEINFEIQKYIYKRIKFLYTPKNLSLQNGLGTYPHKILIGLQVCNSLYHKNCADNVVIDQFFNQSNLFIKTTLITQQYNSYQRNTNKIATELLFALDRTSTFYQRIIMQPQFLEIDDGTLFPDYQTKWIFSDSQVQTQTLFPTYKKDFSAIFLADLTMSFVTQRKFQLIQVQYFQVLCFSVQSGYKLNYFLHLKQFKKNINFLQKQYYNQNQLQKFQLLINHIIYALNEFLMEEELLQQIIGIYYPQFCQLQFKRLLNFGPITEVKYKDKSINLEQFQKFYQNAKVIAKHKLTVDSSIYQTSRLQFAIQKLISRENLKQLNSQGIKLNLSYDNRIKSPRDIQTSQAQVIQYQDIEENVQQIKRNQLQICYLWMKILYYSIRMIMYRKKTKELFKKTSLNNKMKFNNQIFDLIINIKNKVASQIVVFILFHIFIFQEM